MPLSPEAAQILSVLNAHFPALGTSVLDAVEARRLFEQMTLETAEPTAVRDVRDQTIDGPEGTRLPIRVYWPLIEGTTLPVVLFCHGGGWVLCDVDTHDQTCRELANGVGAIVVSVDYRRAPEHRFPAAAEDAYAALVWVASQAAELGGDPSRVAVAGDSAGGNLVVAASLMARDRGGPRVAHQLLMYPILDHDFSTNSYRDNADGYFVTAAHMRWYWEQYLGPDNYSHHPYASPLRAADLTGLPAAHIITAEYDLLRDEGERYAERLRAAGVPTTVRRYDGMFHGFLSFGDQLPAARKANQEIHSLLAWELNRIVGSTPG